MLSTEKVHNVVFVIEDEIMAPKKCCCGSMHFITRQPSKDEFSATYVDCAMCDTPYRIGGFVWPYNQKEM